MTDPVTDAVKRLKRLQQDVERLKAGQDEEGEPRLFLSEQEQLTASDVINIVSNDVLADETVGTADAADIRDNDVAQTDETTTDDATAIRDNDVAQTDETTTSDATAVRGRSVERGLYGSTGYSTSTYSADPSA